MHETNGNNEGELEQGWEAKIETLTTDTKVAAFSESGPSTIDDANDWLVIFDGAATYSSSARASYRNEMG